MAIERDADDIGSDDQFEEPADEAARRESFERAAAAGPDELAGVIEENIRTMADAFENRVDALIRTLVGELKEAIAPGQSTTSPSFVRGATFGAIVLAAGVLLGRRK